MKILVAGDFIPYNRIAAQIENGDYSCLDELSPIIKSADFAIVNFESPVVKRDSNPIAKSGPNLKCSERAMGCIKKAGFGCVTLANNHFRDYGQIGVEDTIDTCIKYHIDYVGGGKNQKEAQKILYKTIHGQLLAIINICENEFSICSENQGGSNPLNLVHNYYDITEARQKANYVVVIVHGGVEGYQFPTPRMQETYRFFVDSGADVVVNHHQHCYSGFEVYKGKPIFYGLGNFCFDKPGSNILWQDGFLVMIDFNKEITFTLYPYNQGSENNAGVALFDDKRSKDFFSLIKHINDVISNKYLLYEQFSKLILATKTHKLCELEPFRNKYLQILQKKGLIPSFVNSKTRLDLFNMMNCESHRELLLEIYKIVIEKNKWNILKM